MAWLKRDNGFIRIYRHRDDVAGWIGQFCSLSTQAMALPNDTWIELDGPISFEGGAVSVPVKKPRTVEDVKEEIVDAAVEYAANPNHLMPDKSFFLLCQELRALQAKAGT